MTERVMEITEEVVNVKCGGNVYPVKLPLPYDVLDYSDGVNKVKDDIRQAVEFNIKFLCKMGLPEEIARRLNTQQLRGLIEKLMGN